MKVNAWWYDVEGTSRGFAVSGRVEYSANTARSIGREADVTRTWFSVIAAGALAAGCAEPNPPPPAPQPAAPAATVAQPADAGAQPESAPSGLPPGQVVGGMP